MQVFTPLGIYILHGNTESSESEAMEVGRQAVSEFFMFSIVLDLTLVLAHQPCRIMSLVVILSRLLTISNYKVALKVTTASSYKLCMFVVKPQHEVKNAEVVTVSIESGLEVLTQLQTTASGNKNSPSFIFEI